MDFSLSPEQEGFLEQVNAFVRDRVAPQAARIDESGAFPRALVSEAAALSLTGLTIQQEWGGGGQDAEPEEVGEARIGSAGIARSRDEALQLHDVEHGHRERGNTDRSCDLFVGVAHDHDDDGDRERDEEPTDLDAIVRCRLVVEEELHGYLERVRRSSTS